MKLKSLALVGALIAAVAVIQTWHGMGEGRRMAFMQAWRIYWRNAPEMAPIREALAGVDLDEPEKLCS